MQHSSGFRTQSHYSSKQSKCKIIRSAGDTDNQSLEDQVLPEENSYLTAFLPDHRSERPKLREENF